MDSIDPAFNLQITSSRIKFHLKFCRKWAGFKKRNAVIIEND